MSATSLPRCASDARSGSAKGSATTSLSETVFSSLSSHSLATAWFFAGRRAVAVLDPVVARHGVDGGQQVRVEDPGDVEIAAQRQELVEAATGGDLLGQFVVLEDGGLLGVRAGLRAEVDRRDQRPEIRRLRSGVRGLGLPGQERPLDPQHVLPRFRGGLTREGDAQLVHPVGPEVELLDRHRDAESLRDAAWGARRTSGRTCHRPPGGRAPAGTRCARRLSSMATRPLREGPTRSPTWASVTVCLPLLVIEPETVTVSPSVGALGLRESRETSTVRDPLAVATEAVSAACAAGEAGSWSSPARRGAPASSAPVRRNHRWAGEGLVPWKSAASATRSPVPRRRQWSSECASTHGNDAR